MPDRAKLQIRLLDAERGLGLGELQVSTPEFFRTPVRHVAAQHITALAEPRPLSPAVDSFPAELREAVCIRVDPDCKRPGRPRVLAQQPPDANADRSEEHTSELQSPCNLVCRLLLEKKKKLLTAVC